MNITKKQILLIITIAILFYSLAELYSELQYNNHEIENFCEGPNCKKSHSHKYKKEHYHNTYYNSYYDTYYNPYYGLRYDPYYGYNYDYNYLYNFWRYLPCVTTPFGDTYCW